MRILFLLALFSLLISNQMIPIESYAKDLSNPLSVEKILLSSDEYDGKTVKVSGLVRTLSPGRGRRGSEFMIIVMEGSKTEPDETSQTLTVFSFTMQPFKKGTRIIASGIYHKAGSWGGSRHENFIEAIHITPVEIN